MTREHPDHHENHFLRRARNHEVRRSRRKRTLVLSLLVWTARSLAVAAVVAVAAHGWEAARTSPRYLLRRVQVVGVHASARQELLDLLARFHGRNLLALSLPQVAAAARTHPWVWEASVKRVLPDTLQVTVKERVPVALALLDNRLHLVDHEGVVMGLPPAPRPGSPEASLDYPIVTGLPRGVAPVPGPNTPADLAAPLHRGIDALLAVGEVAPEMLAAISEVNVESEAFVQLVLRTPARTLRVSDGGIRSELLKYFKVKDAIGQRLPTYRHVDLRFKSRVIVRDRDVG